MSGSGIHLCEAVQPNDGRRLVQSGRGTSGTGRSVLVMTANNVLDTGFEDVFTPRNEIEGLLFALERARAQFAWKVGGLDAAGLNHPHPPSGMTLGGLLKHMAHCEDICTREFLTGETVGPPWNAFDYETDPGKDFRSAVEDSPDELYALWRDAVRRSRTAWSRALADGDLDDPSKQTPPGAVRNLRRALIDVIEHNLRHTGHADLLREAVDGLVGEDPPRERAQ